MADISKRRPLIGITVDAKPNPGDFKTRGKLELNWNYAQAISDAGGVPVLIPPMADMAALARVIHGWLIPGGLDIDARHWGEKNHPAVETVADDRHDAERRLYSAADPQMPILGVCYGCQFLNVARGGTLIQHLPDVVGHETHRDGTKENYSIEDGSMLRRLAGSEISGKSYHHQAVGKLGKGLKAVAEHSDGTIEAIEATDRPWLVGVQWHPERTLEDEASRRLFEGFVSAARAYMESRSAVSA